jgi:hypothetical protein
MRSLNIQTASLDRLAIENSLNQAIVLGAVDRSDASMTEFVQADEFFVVRYPRNWRVGTWNPTQRQIDLTTSCTFEEGCSSLTISVFDLAEGKGPKQYAEDLGRSLGLQPEYRVINVNVISMGGRQVGTVEYLFDRTVKGNLVTIQHTEYIFEGQLSRFHLDFSAPAKQFETYRQLFAEIAGAFTYLRGSS